MSKFVYAFSEGNKSMRDLLGGKGANLSEMLNSGLPVPDGFTVTTEACLKYYDDRQKLGKDVRKQIFDHVSTLEQKTGKTFGSGKNPLLVSVRSGARVSMPGMMDTVLNLGLNDNVAKSMVDKTNNPQFVYDSYRRFIMMFADVVKDCEKKPFDKILDDKKAQRKVQNDCDLSAQDYRDIVAEYKNIYKNLVGKEFPVDPIEQLLEAVEAVFRSWNADRAIIYREINNISNNWGTAVNVQEMVYGNSGNNSGTGVAFTRNPSTGENKLFGEYLINAQGEDVVAGTRTPQPISSLKDAMPEVFSDFVKIANNLEKVYKNMQDMEFTIEDGKLFMLQTRNGKRTARAAIKIAVDMAKEKLITDEEAVMMVEPQLLEQLLHPKFDEKALASKRPLGTALGASPGAASGRIYFDVESLLAAKERGEEKTILVRIETSPEDIAGMNACNGILTLRGGMTSHAAVVARGMGKCCVSGLETARINEEKKTITFERGQVFSEGDYLSLDGTKGDVYRGIIKTVDPEVTEDFAEFMEFVDSVRKLRVRCNADTFHDAQIARQFGAEGIGLCRTEHMFFEEDRISYVRQMILAKDQAERQKALDKLLPVQQQDFEELFEAMDGLAVTIRFIDPPLHEFLPREADEIEALAREFKISYSELENRIESLNESNPMMGHRGCRLAVTYPEIIEMQTKAIIYAAISSQRMGVKVIPELMIPLVSTLGEFKLLGGIIRETAEMIIKREKVSLEYKVGVMLETPRGAIGAGMLAEAGCEFFSFGTNDLTQMTFGFSRDDANKFIKDYLEKGILSFDPFARLDPKGVGKLMEIAKESVKAVNPTAKMGICGEHGGEPYSVAFCHDLGLDYVSCSPFRVPVARLSAAQAKIYADND
ncbi:pyruvate, phosphate dikinase [Francisella adeliensis]|uniref:Pyruvate, phosphate dikinase n=1 Tax=Francisella adeliensis TaxID=2007306 RepID=A0A2Z4XXB3_9GAMM|nr:pyruvate, phosphate dikinase [Francisella adeliensis]AXA33063.1 pyruvate, phosphate dikinase [Francisella adeliensis]MBK2086048.1 pyruvate, phosphate dikinase [Francisella adeliensis]MBK2096788.1 pyruvate, phosphate dikinase [Francisella adeliensis]QIW11291.1 pyruvate, phosphate dikinase [Francisella adeliensis]QIW13166.1 pyruvate, phosphate dikinase [Francisella adeliensis]